MRIAQVCYLFHPAVGGVETHVLSIGSQLVEWGHEVDVLTSDFLALNGLRRIDERHQCIKGVNVFRFPTRVVAKTRVYAQRLRFSGFIRRLFTARYDVVHCHSIASLHYDLSWLVSRLLKIPLVVTGHYSPGDLDRLWTKRRKAFGLTYPTARLVFWRSWMTFALRHTDLVVAIAKSERDRMIDYWKLDPAKVVVIPNGVNPQEFDAIPDSQAQEFRRLRGMEQERLVLFVGRISRLKGPDILVEAALAILAKQGTHGNSVRFLLAGHHEDKELLETLGERIRSAGQQEHISFEQLDRADIIRAFKASDIVVLPSRGEVFGISLVEGMYCGKIVVGSDSGGIPEVIEDGVSGFLFRSDDSQDLARLLQDVIVRYDELEHIREAGKRKAVATYTWERAATKLLQEYEKLMKVNRR